MSNDMASSKSDSKRLLLLTLATSILSVCVSFAVVVYFVFAAETRCTCHVGSEMNGGTSNATRHSETHTASRVATPLERDGKAREVSSQQRNRRNNQPSNPSSDYYFDTLTKAQQSIAVLQTRTHYVEQELSRISSMGQMAGRPGTPGVPGRNGAQGRPGLNGPIGPPGADGPPGKDGRPGAPGSPGTPGINGIPGLQGMMGPKGKKGDHGEPGDLGNTGPKGSRGMTGIHGDDGEPGEPGRRGDKGTKGARGEATCYVTEQGRRVPKPCDLALLDAAQSREKKERIGGATYVRWGRSTCPMRSQRVYRGQAAATKHSTPRTGGSPYVCLPDQPWYFGQSDPRTPFKNNTNPQRGRDTNASPLHGTSFYLTCAVCHARTRGTHVMLPARKECDRGWTREYDGFLVVSSNHRSDQDVICLDRAARDLITDARFVRGLYADCGSLPCPPFVMDEELPCVVCSM